MKVALLASTAPFSGVSDQPQQQQRRPATEATARPRTSSRSKQKRTPRRQRRAGDDSGDGDDGGEQPPPLAPKPPSAARFYLTAKQLRARYGGRSHMWIERRLLSDPTFPRPAYFGRFRFWALDEIEAWERAAIAARGNNSSEAA